MKKNNKHTEVIAEATYYLLNHATIRETAQEFNLSRSTIHRDLTVILPRINPIIYSAVQDLMNKNKSERHIRGGLTTKFRYYKGE